MDGDWVMIKFQSEDAKKMFQFNVSVGTWFTQILQASNDFIVEGMVAWVETEGIPLKMWSETTFKQVPGWTLDFADDKDDDNSSDNESYEGEPNGDDLKNAIELAEGSDLKVVPDTKLDEEPLNINLENASVGKKDARSEDPFNLYDLLNKKKENNNKDLNPNDSLNAFVGNSGGILCVWDPKLFIKLNFIISDYFVIVRGDWVPNGEVVVMMDFNEVHKSEEIYGLLFNVQGADAFNLFISNVDLEEVSLGGCSYTSSLQELEKLQSLEAAQRQRSNGQSRVTRTPSIIMEILSHFKNHFATAQEALLHLDLNFPNMLNSDQLAELEREVTKDEIKRAIWDCGSDKSLGPDG
nr:nucleotide-binding alpha-beta plait domain-containing protein [Tanacetum cinerariifolium]